MLNTFIDIKNEDNYIAKQYLLQVNNILIKLRSIIGDLMIVIITNIAQDAQESLIDDLINNMLIKQKNGGAITLHEHIRIMVNKFSHQEQQNIIAFLMQYFCQTDSTQSDKYIYSDESNESVLQILTYQIICNSINQFTHLSSTNI